MWHCFRARPIKSGDQSPFLHTVAGKGEKYAFIFSGTLDGCIKAVIYFLFSLSVGKEYSYYPHQIQGQGEKIMLCRKRTSSEDTASVSQTIAIDTLLLRRGILRRDEDKITVDTTFLCFFDKSMNSTYIKQILILPKC